MQVISKAVFGSHLYGLNTPESDMDFKGIFIPDLKDLLLEKVPKSINTTTGNNNSKNGKDDVDLEMYSLRYFLELALKGETVALDMLHAKSMIVSSPEWTFLVDNRTRFYTKNLKAFMGYLKRQVAKYSVKGSRLSDISEAIEAIEDLQVLNGKLQRLNDIWDYLPEGEYLKKVDDGDKKFYEVNAKKYQSTVTVKEVYELLHKMYDSYGARAKLAEKNDSIDWKAVSHAFRAGYQLRDIYTKGDFEYPLKETLYIKAVKAGHVDFKKDAQPELERLMEEVEELANNSNLPEKPDREFWDKWLLDVYKIRLLT